MSTTFKIILRDNDVTELLGIRKWEVFPCDSVEKLLERAKGKYTSGMNKEGIVIRPAEPVYSKIIEGPLSMKVLNNEYLLGE